MAAKSAIIIGAGIGGMALANMLAKAGLKVTVLEKNDQLGGRAGVLKTNGFTYDTGPSWYLMPAVFRHYFDLFGVDIEKELNLQRLTPAYKVFFESSDPLTIQGDVEKDAVTFERIEKGAARALRSYVQTSDDIYQLALRHFLYTNFISKKQLLHPQIVGRAAELAASLTIPLHTTVRKVVRTPQLQKILEYPMVFLGTSPFHAPSMYRLMSALDFKEGVFYPKKGMYSIIESLKKIGDHLGVSYTLNSPVRSITVTNGKAHGVILDDNSLLEADIVISNADLHFTETQLLDSPHQSYPASYWKKKQPGISALLLYVGVKGSLPTLEHHNLFFVDDWKQNFEDIYKNSRVPKSASLYISKTSRTDSSVAPKDHENLFVLMPLPAGKTLSKEDERTLASRCIAQLAKITKQSGFAERVTSLEIVGPQHFSEHFNSWQGSALGMSHVLTQSAFWRPGVKSKKVSNLFYVGGNTLPGIGLPMCLISAELVYKHLADDRTSGPIKKIEELG